MRTLVQASVVLPVAPAFGVTDAIPIVDNLTDFLILVEYTKGTEAAFHFFAELSIDNAGAVGGDWYRVTGMVGPGVNPILTYEATLAATSNVMYQVPVKIGGFYRIRYWATAPAVAPGSIVLYSVVR